MKTGKFVFVVLLLIVPLFCFSGCEFPLELVDLEIVAFPDKLVYVAEESYGLELSGCEVEERTKIGSEERVRLLDQDELNKYISHNIDFGIPGQYRVVLRTPVQEYEEFYIQVVSKEQVLETLDALAREEAR